MTDFWISDIQSWCFIYRRCPCLSVSSDFAMQRFDRESEVYKMILENKESRASPRQSNTFKMLQEVLEADEKGKKHTAIPNCLNAENSN